MAKVGLSTAVATLGAIAAGVALLDVALIPGVLIGGAAMVLPEILPRRRRQVRRAAPVAPPAARRLPPAGLSLRRAVLKTISFRVVVAVFDFAGNYLVIGELATAASLSGISLVAGPLFYLAHEIGWSHLRPDTLRHPVLVKTITFRSVASVAEFSVNYAVVGELLDAALLSSMGIVFGPFVYYGHERLWERLGPPPTIDVAPVAV